MRQWRAAAVAAGMCGAANAAPGVAEAALDELRACLALAANDARLACFDDAVRRLSPPRFAGRLSEVTPPFHIDAPARLRFQSDGAIFVLYLRHADGRVAQNLHLGGGGEGRYVIEQPGDYFLQINGSEGWRIWLEPL